MQTLYLCKFYSLSSHSPCQIFMAVAIAPKKATNFTELRISYESCAGCELAFARTQILKELCSCKGLVKF